MPQIKKFILDPSQAVLHIELQEPNAIEPINLQLHYEYMRVFSPAEMKKIEENKGSSNTPAVFHKKNVKILAIEPLGKHGHRIIFDDGFNDIFSTIDIVTLTQQYNHLWQQYIDNINSVNNREETINFKSVT